MVQTASRGGYDPVIGREEEIRRVIQILIRRGKNNPVLLGEPGVGKTAVAEGLAQKMPWVRFPMPCGKNACWPWISPPSLRAPNTAGSLRSG